MFFLLKMLVRWWLTLYFKVCVVRPTYCFLHLLHVMRYMRLEDEQENECLMGYLVHRERKHDLAGIG